MATNDFDSEAMLAFFRQLGTEVDNLKTKIASLNESGGGGMKKLTDETDRFGKTIERHTRSIHGMRQETGGLLEFLKGPAGLAAAFIGAAKAMDVFAVGQLQLRNFALNTGFTVDAVQKMRIQLAAAGIDAGEASSQIASLGGKLTELRTHQEASSFYRALQASSPALAEQVRLLMNAGKQQEANNLLQEAYNRGGERFKDYLVEITGKSRAAWEAGRKGMEGLLAPWKFNEQAAADYHKQVTNLGTVFENVWTHMSYTMLEEITKQIGGVKELEKASQEFAKNFSEFWKSYVSPTIATTVQEFNAIVSGIKAVDEFMKSRGPQGQMKPEDFIKGQNEKKSGYDYLFGGDGDQLPPNARPRSFSPDSVEGKELAKDSNSLLRDMRDMMQKDQSEHPGPGGAGGRGGILFRPGMRGGGGGGGGDVGAGVDTAPIPAGAGTSNEAIAAQRKPLIDEINNNPALKEKVFSMLQSEESGVGPRTATMEALLNRTLMIQKKNPSWTIAKELSSGFYGPINRGELTTTRGRSRAQSEAAVASAAAGSMVAQGRTDQGMVGDPNAGGPGRVRVPGTGGIFNYWKGYRPGAGNFSWADSQRFAEEEARIAAAGGRGRIDSSLRSITGGDLGTANVSVDFKNMPRGVVGNANADGAFKKVQISRSPQAPAAGGAATTFNEWGFE